MLENDVYPDEHKIVLTHPSIKNLQVCKHGSLFFHDCLSHACVQISFHYQKATGKRFKIKVHNLHMLTEIYIYININKGVVSDSSMCHFLKHHVYHRLFPANCSFYKSIILHIPLYRSIILHIKWNKKIKQLLQLKPVPHPTLFHLHLQLYFIGNGLFFLF
jgi:hypothetical protein